MQPILLADSHHGIYCGQVAFENLRQMFRKELRGQIPSWVKYALLKGPNSRNYIDATLHLETLEIPGYYVIFADDVWLWPEGKEYQELA